jgi:hypothetical protein
VYTDGQRVMIGTCSPQKSSLSHALQPFLTTTPSSSDLSWNLLWLVGVQTFQMLGSHHPPDQQYKTHRAQFSAKSPQLILPLQDLDSRL